MSSHLSLSLSLILSPSLSFSVFLACLRLFLGDEKKKCFHTETTVEWMQLIFSQKRAPFKEKPQNPFLPLFIRLIS